MHTLGRNGDQIIKNLDGLAQNRTILATRAKSVCFSIGHVFLPHLQFTMCFLFMHISSWWSLVMVLILKLNQQELHPCPAG